MDEGAMAKEACTDETAVWGGACTDLKGDHHHHQSPCRPSPLNTMGGAVCLVWGKAW